jgi:hypothetical protein
MVDRALLLWCHFLRGRPIFSPPPHSLCAGAASFDSSLQTLDFLSILRSQEDFYLLYWKLKLKKNFKNLLINFKTVVMNPFYNILL